MGTVRTSVAAGWVGAAAPAFAAEHVDNPADKIGNGPEDQCNQ